MATITYKDTPQGQTIQTFGYDSGSAMSDISSNTSAIALSGLNESVTVDGTGDALIWLFVQVDVSNAFGTGQHYMTFRITRDGTAVGDELYINMNNNGRASGAIAFQQTAAGTFTFGGQGVSTTTSGQVDLIDSQIVAISTQNVIA